VVLATAVPPRVTLTLAVAVPVFATTAAKSKIDQTGL
jgi:hypothetical protein